MGDWGGARGRITPTAAAESIEKPTPYTEVSAEVRVRRLGG